MSGCIVLIETDSTSPIGVSGILRSYISKGYSIIPFIPKVKIENPAISPDNIRVDMRALVYCEAAKTEPTLRLFPSQGTEGSMDEEEFEKAKIYLEQIEEEEKLVVVIMNDSMTGYSNEFIDWLGAPVFPVGTKSGIENFVENTKTPWETEMLLKGCVLYGDKGLKKVSDLPVTGRVNVEKESYSELLALFEVFKGGGIDACAVNIPNLSIYSDLFALRIQDDLTIRWVNEPWEAENCDMLIVPASENPCQDMVYMKRRGFEEMFKHKLGKIPILGFCAGYAMFGRRYYTEGDNSGRLCQGMGLADFETVLRRGDYLECARYRFSGEQEWLDFPVAGSRIYRMAGIMEHGVISDVDVKAPLEGALRLKLDFTKYEEVEAAINFIAETTEIYGDIREF
ncbi:hypothetical protein [Limisalsivibrio acetivorans]|uniref:hypothetical protein n=1 Tax=Limisalsivibrio acetivorans TaxID=1304888 RepID=UPI000422D9D2|nr:hypothetical protein [Limisalsivibrio acetivorans]